MKPLNEILLRFHLHPMAVHFDIMKMYHSMYTRKAKKMMRLMFWEDKDGNEHIYGPTRVMYGNCPAAAAAEITKDIGLRSAEATQTLQEILED